MDILQTLQQFDLSKNESAVYIALLQLGLTNVGPIVKQTGLHRQLIYEALESLERNGFISSVVKNNRKHFQAGSPGIIVDRARQKESEARSLLPELLKLQKDVLDKIEVKTLYGRNGFFDNLREVVESAARTDGAMRIIGGAKDSDFYKVIGRLYQDYVDILQKQKVKKYLIAPEHFSEEFKKKFAKEKGNILKTMTGGLSSPTYTRITPEMVTIEIYSGGSDITIIQIRNKAIAKSYLEHFELLWGQAQIYT